MILYYTMGGGFGHIMRTWSVCSLLKLPLNKVIFLSSTPEIKKLIPRAKYITPRKQLNTDKKGFYKYIANIVEKFKIKTIILDAFPLGILGEFEYFSLPHIRFVHIARILNWNEYKKTFSSIPFLYHLVYICERLPENQLLFYKRYSSNIISLALSYISKPDIHYQFIRAQIHGKYMLVVHSGPQHEVRQLLNKAITFKKSIKQEINILVFTQSVPFCESPNLFWFDYSKAYEFFQDAEHIFTGCGFNSMQQCAIFRHKHTCIPFQRKYDDQFLRHNFVFSKS